MQKCRVQVLADLTGEDQEFGCAIADQFFAIHTKYLHVVCISAIFVRYCGLSGLILGRRTLSHFPIQKDLLNRIFLILNCFILKRRFTWTYSWTQNTDVSIDGSPGRIVDHP